MARKSMQTQIGVEMNDGTQTFVAGQKLDLAVQPVDRDKDRRLSTTVFVSTMQATPSSLSGDMKVYTFDVLGGLCGVEALLHNGSGNLGTDVEGAGKGAYNMAVGCTSIRLEAGGCDPEVDTGNYCLTADPCLAPLKIGKVTIHNLGGHLPTYGYKDPTDMDPLGDNRVDHPGTPFDAAEWGDVLYWGMGAQSRRTDEEQIEEGNPAPTGPRDPHRDLFCSCDGVPGWYADLPDENGNPLDPDWLPCHSGGYNDNPVATGIPAWFITDRTYTCFDVIWRGRIPAGGSVDVPIPQTDSPNSPSASGIVLKFVAGPGKYNKHANQGKPFGPTPALQLYRDVRQPKTAVKIEVYPAPK
jgi:hypothetical protein